MPANTWQRAAEGFREVADDLDDLNHGPSVRGLLNRGFDIQNGMLMVATSHGAFPVAPAFAAPGGGDVPKGLEQEVADVRRTLSDKYDQAFTRWLGLAIDPRNGGESGAFARLSASERNALSEGDAAAGGFIVPLTLCAEILSRAAAQSVIRQRAHIIPTLTDVLTLPAFKASASAPSTYTSDMLAAWNPEVPISDTSDPAFEKFTIPVRKLRTGLLKVSEDLAADQPAALDWLATAGATDLALRGDAGFVAGTGSNHQPLGILEAGITTVDVEGSTANTISNTTGNAGSFPKIAQLVDAVPVQYRGNPSSAMIASATAEQNLMRLVDGAGARAYRRGLPVEGFRLAVSPFVEADGTDGRRVLLAGDFSNFIIASRSLTVRVLREAPGLADSGNVGLLLIERLGGGLWNTDAIRAGAV